MKSNRYFSFSGRLATHSIIAGSPKRFTCICQNRRRHSRVSNLRFMCSWWLTRIRFRGSLSSLYFVLPFLLMWWTSAWCASCPSFPQPHSQRYPLRCIKSALSNTLHTLLFARNQPGHSLSLTGKIGRCASRGMRLCCTFPNRCFACAVRRL